MSKDGPKATTEKARLEQANRGEENWRRWGPYLSERQWGTVREDYSREWQCVGIFTARSRPQPRVSLGRGWHRWHQR